MSAAVMPSPSPLLLKPYHVLMSIVFAVALGAAYTMLPDDNEIIAMLERDGHSGDAIAILEDNYKQGDRRYRTLHQLLALYENEGDTVKARTIMEEMAIQRPNDAALRERLARFYRAIGDGDARMEALKGQIALRYNEAACREFVSLVRLKGDADAEISALQMCRQKGYRRPDDLARLGVLLAATGQRPQALVLLRSIDDVRRLKLPEERQLLIALLLEQQQPNEAERRAIRWIKPGGNHALALSIVDEFASARYSDSALEVAKAAGEPGDSISLTVAERLLERSQPKAASLYLKGWLENAQFDTADVIERFMAAAIEAEDPETALAGAKKFGLMKVPQAALASLAMVMASKGMSIEAAQVRAVLSGTEPDPAPGALLGGGMPQVPFANSSQAPAQASSAGGAVSARANETQDPLAAWRRTLAARMAEDAQRHMPSTGAGMGPAMPRHTQGAAERPGQHANKVLKKASGVLQRSKHLKSLKLKQRLVRERAAKQQQKKP